MTDGPQALPVVLFADGHPRFPTEWAGLPDEAQAWAALIARHGPTDAASHVQGDFAIALRMGDGSVYMAVDRFATRSLCWRVDAAGLRCAGRADALAGDSTGDLTPLSTQAVFDYLYFHTIPSPRTVFNDVHRLPPGHCAQYRDGAMTVTAYWRPRFEPVQRPSFDSLRTEFRSLLRDAVARQYDGTVPACFLSGGTDSSTVAGMLAEVAPRKPICYSIGFEADGYDEMAYARIAARRFGCEHREIYFTPEDLVRQIPLVAAAYDQPFGNSSALPSYHAAAHAHADGVTRMLAGDGGDELFGGNARYAAQRLFEPWERLPRLLRDAVLTPLFSAPGMAHVPLLRKGASYVRQANTPMPERVQDYNLIRRVGYDRLFTPAFMAAVKTDDVMKQQRNVWAGADGGSEIDHHLAFDWRYTLAECDLPKVVGTTTLAGVSVGFPMLDDALLAFSMRLPTDYKLRRGALRWFFKEALRGYLPDEILQKKKQGFGLPFGVWMVEHPALNHLARDALQGTVKRGLLRADFVHAFFDQLLPEHPHYYGTIAWIFLMLEHWMRAHAADWSLGNTQ